MDVIHEPAPAVDIDHGDPFAVLGLELGVAVDRHLTQLEAELRVGSADDPTRRLAEVAARRRVEDDLGYG